MSCACHGGNCRCNGPIGIGSYAAVDPFAQTGYRLSVPGGPVGGQYHGLPSANVNPGISRAMAPGAAHKRVYRSPAELPPRPNAGGHQNILHVKHSPRLPGYSMVPGGLYSAPTLGALPVVTPPSSPMHWVRPVPPWGSNGPMRNYPVDTTIPSGPTSGATNVAPMPAPGSITAPAPTVSTPCPSGQYQDAAGNCTDDWHNPYPLYLPAQPSPVVSASTASTPTAGQPGCVSGEYDVNGNCIVASTTPGTTPSWFTDPTQELISGIPNWGLLAAAAGVFMLMGKRR